MNVVIFQNEKDDKSVKEAKKLNFLSQHFRKCMFKRKFKIDEGFNLSFIDFVWEYEVQKGKSLIVFRELDQNNIKFWAYKNGNEDVNPMLCKVVQIPSTNYGGKQFCDLIEIIFKNI
jgi:hypothetical protein